MSALTLRAGCPEPLGATSMTLDGVEGVNFAVLSERAEAIELCLFSSEGREETARAELPARTGHIRHGFAPGLRPGALYGFRAHGRWAPSDGDRFNPQKLLLDPWARAYRGETLPHSLRLLGHDPEKGDHVASPVDSAPDIMKCVVAEPMPRVPDSERPRRSWSETVIYEAHVKGLTRLHPGVPESLRGTYEALASESLIEHLAMLGVTAVELLPVHAFLDEPRLRRLGLSNYWGYNSIGFFAPEPRYFGPKGAAGLREAIKRLHSAGIEVILDVVYNHTAEGDHKGPTLSFRGLDNHAWYRLHADRRERYVNDTGCGNTLAADHPFGVRLILDSLRHWVEHWGVDGFRFDLAPALGRADGRFRPDSPLLSAMLQDPVLREVKLIVEPWDLGPEGHRLGDFPSPMAEWSDRFRDQVRRFWRGDDGFAAPLGDRMLGSAGVFDRAGRRPWASVNFVACHDGFTLADVASYRTKHNETNKEDNRDGASENFSDGCGVEGTTTDAGVLARRAKRRRNLAATVLLAQGTPMLLAGDEIANSQGGNNNAYCQDNEIGWIDWSKADDELHDFVRRLTAFRRAHPALRQEWWLHSKSRPDDGRPDAIWRAFDGGPMVWTDPALGRFVLVVRGCAEDPDDTAGEDAVAVVMNRGSERGEVVLPSAPTGRAWARELDTAAPQAEPAVRPGGSVEAIAAESVVAFGLTEAPADEGRGRGL